MAIDRTVDNSEALTRQLHAAGHGNRVIAEVLGMSNTNTVAKRLNRHDLKSNPPCDCDPQAADILEHCVGAVTVTTTGPDDTINEKPLYIRALELNGQNSRSAKYTTWQTAATAGVIEEIGMVAVRGSGRTNPVTVISGPTSVGAPMVVEPFSDPLGGTVLRPVAPETLLASNQADVDKLLSPGSTTAAVIFPLTTLALGLPQEHLDVLAANGLVAVAILGGKSLPDCTLLGDLDGRVLLASTVTGAESLGLPPVTYAPALTAVRLDVAISSALSRLSGTNTTPGAVATIVPIGDPGGHLLDRSRLVVTNEDGMVISNVVPTGITRVRLIDPLAGAGIAPKELVEVEVSMYDLPSAGSARPARKIVSKITCLPREASEAHRWKDAPGLATSMMTFQPNSREASTISPRLLGMMEENLLEIPIRTGWATVDGEPVFSLGTSWLTASGAVVEMDPTWHVRLKPEMRTPKLGHLAFMHPAELPAAASVIRDTDAIRQILEPHFASMLLVSHIRAALPVNYGLRTMLFFAGSGGSGKTYRTTLDIPFDVSQIGEKSKATVALGSLTPAGIAPFLSSARGLAATIDDLHPGNGSIASRVEESKRSDLLADIGRRHHDGTVNIRATTNGTQRDTDEASRCGALAATGERWSTSPSSAQRTLSAFVTGLWASSDKDGKNIAALEATMAWKGAQSATAYMQHLTMWIMTVGLEKVAALHAERVAVRTEEISARLKRYRLSSGAADRQVAGLADLAATIDIQCAFEDEMLGLSDAPLRDADTVVNDMIKGWLYGVERLTDRTTTAATWSIILAALRSGKISVTSIDGSAPLENLEIKHRSLRLRALQLCGWSRRSDVIDDDNAITSWEHRGAVAGKIDDRGYLRFDGDVLLAANVIDGQQLNELERGTAPDALYEGDAFAQLFSTAPRYTMSSGAREKQAALHISLLDNDDDNAFSCHLIQTTTGLIIDPQYALGDPDVRGPF